MLKRVLSYMIPIYLLAFVAAYEVPRMQTEIQSLFQPMIDALDTVQR